MNGFSDGQTEQASQRGGVVRVLRTVAVATLLALAVTGCAEVHAEVKAEAAGGEAAETHASTTSKRVVTVTTMAAAERAFEERLTVQGNLEARAKAAVGSKLAGTLTAIMVDEGDTVVAGETVLFRTDDAQLIKAVEAQRMGLAAAKVGIREAKARKAQVAVELKKARRDFERFEKLHASKTITEDALEQAEARYQGAKASHSHVKVLIDLASAQKRQAEVALQIAEQNLSDATILAPVSGVVTRKEKELGERAAPGQPVVHIEDPSVVEVSAFLPASYYPRVAVGSSKLNVKVYGVELGARSVSYKSPTINAKTRTFEVRCLVENPDGKVAPGAMAQVDVTLSRESGLGVPVDAVVERSGRSAVFVADGETARLVTVERGLESDGWVLIKSDALKPGAAIVTVGQSMLDDGSPIRIGELKQSAAR